MKSVTREIVLFIVGAVLASVFFMKIREAEQEKFYDLAQSSYQDGYRDGYRDGSDTGLDYDTGYSDGEDDGYIAGYNAGYAEGHEEAQTHTETYDELLRQAYQSTRGAGAGFKTDEDGKIWVQEYTADGRQMWVPFTP